MIDRTETVSDPFDRATQLEEMARAAALAERKPAGPEPTGGCLNPECDDDVAPGVRWCSAECRDRWQKYKDRT